MATRRVILTVLINALPEETDDEVREEVSEALRVHTDFDAFVYTYEEAK